MATLEQAARLGERIDDFLSYPIGEWGAIPELAAEWEEWTAYERGDFALEWPIREDRLAQLARYGEAGLLTPSQRRRHEQLLALVARHRPELEWLFRDRGLRRQTMTTKHEVDGRARTLTREEGRALLDRRARHYLGLSGDEFVRAWKAGELDDNPDRPEGMRVAMVVPLGQSWTRCGPNGARETAHIGCRPTANVGCGRET